LYIKIYVHLGQYLAELLPKKEMFQTSIANKIGTNIVCSLPSEQESGWALGQPVWTLRTGSKETFPNRFSWHSAWGYRTVEQRRVQAFATL